MNQTTSASGPGPGAGARRLRKGLGVTAIAAAMFLAIHGVPSALASVSPGPQAAYVQTASPPSFANLVKAVKPAVVNIATKVKNPQISQNQPQMRFPPGFPPNLRQFFRHQFQGAPQQMPGAEMMALGSGFIISPDGYVVTNNHVIEHADSITVTLSDGTQYKAKLVGRDKKTDLAVLKINPKHPLHWVKFGNSNKASVGDWVVAVGNPFGLGGTVTAGIISARGRDIRSGPYDDYLQVDAPINKGNSGGPLFDHNGRVIGINTAIYSPSGGSVGIGFAIPSDLAKPVITALRTKGHVDRGWIGVEIQQVTPSVAQAVGLDKPEGALVASVQPDGPAAKAGVKSGDVILDFGGHKVKTLHDLPMIVADTPRGESDVIKVWRNGEERSLTVDVGAYPSNSKVAMAGSSTSGTAKPQLGLAVEPLTPDMRQQLGLGDAASGVVVAGVDQNGPAAREGVRPGDLIKRVGQHEVRTPADVAKAVKGAVAAKRHAVLLLISRNGHDRFIAIPLGKA